MGFIILWANNFGVVKNTKFVSVLDNVYFHTIILKSVEEVYSELWRYDKLSDRS